MIRVEWVFVPSQVRRVGNWFPFILGNVPQTEDRTSRSSGDVWRHLDSGPTGVVDGPLGMGTLV